VKFPEKASVKETSFLVVGGVGVALTVMVDKMQLAVPKSYNQVNLIFTSDWQNFGILQLGNAC
jgi:hypothetical protein